jgi:hypothetical protein
VAAEPVARRSILIACGLVVGWAAMMMALGRTSDLCIEVVLRRPHYLQLFVQGSLYAYWGWYWPEVARWLPFLLAQLLLAYALESLIAWSRRDAYTLGMGPFPIVLSTNLFLWFRPSWFYWQLLLIFVAFAAKEWIRWQRDGRTTHIFNPSSFALAVFSAGLIITHGTGITQGIEIASTLFYPPQIYLFIFLIALPSQLFFGVASMTMPAVLTTYGLGLAYFAATGTYFFFDSYIPIAVFLGMSLLFTDPATAPKSDVGRVVFGALYGAAVVLTYAWLRSIDAPEFYDKLLPIPLLNLSVRALDRLARSGALSWMDPARIVGALSPYRRHLAYIGVWVLVFAGMSAAQGVGDTHRGHEVPFWQQACAANRSNACRNLAQMEARYCDLGSGWACNEVGVLAYARPETRNAAMSMFQRACGQGFQPACGNAAGATRGDAVQRGEPTLADLPIVLRRGKGPLPPMSEGALYALACSQGWRETCNHREPAQAHGTN